MKRERARPTLKPSAGYEEAPGGASRTSRKRENRYSAPLGESAGAYTKKYAPPTTVNNFETIQPAAAAAAALPPGGGAPYRQHVATNVLAPGPPTPTMHNNQYTSAISPQSDSNVDGPSPNGERPPSRVFFPRNNPAPIAMDDSLTIDSELDDPSTTLSQSVSPTSPAVYHLAHHDGDIRKPSPKHRAKLEAWYRKQNGEKSAPMLSGGGDRKQSTTSTSNILTGSMGGVARRERGASATGARPRRDDRERIYDGPSHTMSTEDDGDGYSYTSHRGLSTVASGDYPESLLSKVTEDEDDEDYLHTKQEIAFFSIGITSIQLLIICLQFAMCGIAPFEVNPFVGPYPDAFSEWGSKNSYLMLVNQEYWRMLSSSGLSVGILHLLANAFCQLEPVAIFEREWGSFRWLLIYLLSSVGCNTLSVYVDPDTIAVGSSGSLMGLFAAKLAQVFIHTLFEVNKLNQDEYIRLDQLSSVVCGLIIISLLSFFTFIDWSGHLGGLMAGFFSGMVLFSTPIRSCCVRFLWTFLGLSGLVVTLTGSIFLALTETEPSEDLADACYFFRNLYPEDYECGCFA